MEKFEVPEKLEEEEKVKVKLDSDNDFIKICKFIYQMLCSEEPLHKFNNDADELISLREILKKYKVFFKVILDIKNVQDYFKNLEKIECKDQTFKKLINKFGKVKNTSDAITEFIGKVKEEEEKDKTEAIKANEVEDEIKDEGDNVGNNKIKMDWLGIRAIMEEACEVVFFLVGWV